MIYYHFDITESIWHDIRVHGPAVVIRKNENPENPKIRKKSVAKNQKNETPKT